MVKKLEIGIHYGCGGVVQRVASFYRRCQKCTATDSPLALLRDDVLLEDEVVGDYEKVLAAYRRGLERLPKPTFNEPEKTDETE